MVADKPGTDRHTDAFINECINQSYAKLYNQIVATANDYNIQTSLFDTEAGESIYALPATFYKMRGLFFRDASGYMREVRQRTLQTPHNGTYSDLYTDKFTYAMVGDNLELEPTPNGVYSFELRYYPAAGKMDDDTDVIDGISGWEEFVVWDVACLLMTLDKEDQGSLAGYFKFRDDAMQDVINKAATRNFAEPPRIHRRRVTRLPNRWRTH